MSATPGSLIEFTADVKRVTSTATDGGGETDAETTVYTGMKFTANYVDRTSTDRMESGRGAMRGPGPLLLSDWVLINDPWDGVKQIRQNDVIDPNPAITGLPTRFKVIAPKYYEDELQLRCQEVSTPTGVT